MELRLQAGDAALLADILQRFLSDLRMEVASTENYDLRQTMKHNEDAIRRMLEQLSGGTPATQTNQNAASSEVSAKAQ